MPLTRRGWLAGSSAVALGACADEAPRRPRPPPAPPAATAAPRAPEAAPSLADVLGRAIDTAKRQGATYADARVHQKRISRVVTREDHVVSVSDEETYGIGVRVLVDGAWGFASSSSVDDAAAAEAAGRAVAVARANAAARKRPVELAPAGTFREKWSTELAVDPFAVPLAERAAFALAVWPEARKVAGVAFCAARVEAFGEWKLFASTEGSLIEQAITRVGAGYELTAKNDAGEFVTRASELSPRQAGWEYLAGSSLLRDARELAEDAVEKLKAPSVVPGKRDLVLAPSHLWLTIHESVGHPTELDRAMGYEANMAGTSFATPDKLGKLRYASNLVTIYADKTTPGGLATCAYDDDGVKTQRFDLVKDGTFVGYQTTREQAGWVGERASRGTSYAQDHRSVAFQRMPNVSLAPGARAAGLDDLVAATDDGILIRGSGSWSIDHQRYNFQFGGQMFYEIKKGKIARALKDVAYQSNSLEFWNGCDLLGGPDAWELHGSLGDGKGEPAQSNAMSHGCPPARFRKVNVINTNARRKA
jgi:TldD protein